MNHGTEDISILEKSRRNCSFFLFPELNSTPHSPEDSEKNKHCDDPRVVPFVFRASPLKSKQDAYYGGDEDENSNGVHPLEFVQFPGFNLGLTRRIFEEKGDENRGNRSEWKIDVEAPSPADFISQ
jgi:hypothetical protein